MLENSNFICLTRSLIEKSAWVDARPTHQTVFIHILLRCAFKEIEHNIQGNIIKILPGQLCATIRQIQDWSGKWISKNDVEGSIKYFQKVNFLRQEIRHGKTLLTIIDSDIYNCLIRSNQTTCQTEVRQKSDIKEEREERKEEHISPSASPSGEKIIDLNSLDEFTENDRIKHNVYNQTTKLCENELNSNKISENKTNDKQKSTHCKIAFRDNVLLTQSEYDKLLSKHGNSALDWMLDKLNNQKHSTGRKYKSDYHAILNWVINAYQNSFSKKQTSEDESQYDLSDIDPFLQKRAEELITR